MYKATPPPEMLIENGELLALKKVTFGLCMSEFGNLKISSANTFQGSSGE